MKYQKIANLLDNASNKTSKFRSRNWVEINDEIRGAYSPNKQISFKTAMLRSSLRNNSDAYILVKDIYQLILQPQVPLQIMLIKK